MKPLVSKSLREVKPSLLDAFFTEASKKEDVISLSVGEPDFDTPWHIATKGIQAIQEGKTFYTPSQGLLSLREAIAGKLVDKYKVDCSSNQILITNGASEAIDIIMRALIDSGDEIILTDPGYVSYEPLVQLAGGIPIHLRLVESEKFKINIKLLRSLITSKTKALIINYPNNPTGATMTKSELNEVAKVCYENGIMVISDEIYSDLIYTKASGSILECDKEYLDNVIYINGLSKSYAMTGWRIGYILAPLELIHAFNTIHQYSTMCPSTISQYAGVEAILNGDDDIQSMRKEYLWRRNYLVKSLNELGLDCLTPSGAFYAFPSIEKYQMKSVDFCTRLLNECKLAVIPGVAFGEQGEHHIRISYAYSFKDLEEGLKRIKAFIEGLK